MQKRSKLTQYQIKYLELLRDNGLLDQAVDGKLPAHIEAAAKKAAILSPEFAGCKTNDEKTVMYGSAEDNDEAAREIEEFLKHYKVMRDIHTAVKKRPRILVVGRCYAVRSGYFKGRTVTLRGTDLQIFQQPWHDVFSFPACEKFAFRAQQDGLDLMNGQVLVCGLNGENRDILLHEKEIGAEVL